MQPRHWAHALHVCGGFAIPTHAQPAHSQVGDYYSNSSRGGIRGGSGQPHSSSESDMSLDTSPHESPVAPHQGPPHDNMLNRRFGQTWGRGLGTVDQGIGSDSAQSPPHAHQHPGQEHPGQRLETMPMRVPLQLYHQLHQPHHQQQPQLRQEHQQVTLIRTSAEVQAVGCPPAYE
jgi:hypothetical protein